MSNQLHTPHFYPYCMTNELVYNELTLILVAQQAFFTFTPTNGATSPQTYTG